MSPVVRIKPGEVGPPLFCIHPAGGNTLCYIEMARRLGPEHAVLGLQPRGWDDAQPPLTSIEEEAEYLVEHVRQHQPRGPYRLAGWSYGGLVAYEMAIRMRRDGDDVELLVLIDVPAVREVPEVDDSDLLCGFMGDALPFSPDEMRAMGSLENQLGAVISEGIKYHLLPEGFTLEQARHLFDIGKANFFAANVYEPGPAPGRCSSTAPSTPPTADIRTRPWVGGRWPARWTWWRCRGATPTCSTGATSTA